MERRFARFRRAPLTDYPDSSEIPDAGMCLNAFVVLQPTGADDRVLLGQLDPRAPWEEIGALGRARLDRVGSRWMLPSRQLAFYESPDDAARAIVVEQLGLPGLPLDGPTVLSDPADRPAEGSRDLHWDLHFVYRGRWPGPAPPVSAAWRTLAFVDVRALGREAIARGQRDVLELAGIVPSFSPSP